MAAVPSNANATSAVPHLVLPEDELVKRARVLDEGALCSMFDTYYPKIYKYGLIQLREVQAAEDLASDVMLRVIESIPRYRTKGVPLSAWIFRIARNRLVDIHRRGNRRREVGLGSDYDAGSGSVPHVTVERALDYGEVCMALSQLTEVQEQVIVLRFLKDLDVATVARTLGRSESAIKSLQFRALTSLRRIMQRGQGDSAHAEGMPSYRRERQRMATLS